MLTLVPSVKSSSKPRMIFLIFFHRAAFQFGIKVSEGRRTRLADPKDEKARLRRDWQNISQAGILCTLGIKHSVLVYEQKNQLCVV